MMDHATRRDPPETRDGEADGKTGARGGLQSARRGGAARAARVRELRLGEGAGRRRAGARRAGRASEKVG